MDASQMPRRKEEEAHGTLIVAIPLLAGSINYHRIIVSKFYEIRFVRFWILFGSKYKFAQSCSPLHSFTHLHFDLKNKSKI